MYLQLCVSFFLLVYILLCPMSRTTVIAHALSNDTAEGKAMITAGITTMFTRYGEHKDLGNIIVGNI